VKLVTTGIETEQVRVVTWNADEVDPRGGMEAPRLRVINPEDVPAEFRQYID